MIGRRRGAVSAAALLALVLGATARAQPAPEARAYLEDALSFVERSSFYRRQVDWPALRQTAHDLAAHAQTAGDTHAALRFVLAELRDRHSTLFTAAQTEEVFERQPDPLPTGGRLPGRIGYLKLPHHLELSDGGSYAAAAGAVIRRADAAGVCAWVVDLRGNFGGNFWPMLAAVGPILGEGDAGAFVDGDGNRTVWSYRRGNALLGDRVVARGTPYRPRRPRLPVVLVTDSTTASAAEATLVSFRGRAQTWTFGQPTAGVPTATVTRRLSDGALLVVMWARDADRTGRTYESSLEPDRAVAPETAVEAARRWLRGRAACRKAN